MHVTANILRQGGLDVDSLDIDRKWVPLKLLFSRTAWSRRVAHMVWGGDVAASLVAHSLMRRKLVWHWIGSDVLALRKGTGITGRLRRHLARQVKIHFADSPQLAEELKTLGIEATVCRLLPATVRAEVLPMPKTFRVLTYWRDAQAKFYGSETVRELARQMSETEFLIAGAEGKSACMPENVKFLGVVDMVPVYEQTSVFLRIPEHDSLSAMVLEALARGRHVVYNQPFPHCHLAKTVEEIRSALEHTRTLSGPNVAGSEMVRKQFNPNMEAEQARRVYLELFRLPPRGQE